MNLRRRKREKEREGGGRKGRKEKDRVASLYSHPFLRPDIYLRFGSSCIVRNPFAKIRDASST